MALTTLQVAQIFQVLCLPQDGLAVVATTLSHRPPTNTQVWAPTYNQADMTALVTVITARITAANSNADLCTLIGVELARWGTIGSSPLVITHTSAGAQGIIIHYDKERENIRQRVGNLLGVSVPEGGFLKETEITWGKHPAQLVAGGGLDGDR